MAYIGFKKLAAKIGSGAAAMAGRKKYGDDKFNKAAAEGKKMKGMKPKKSGGIISKLRHGGTHKRKVTKTKYSDTNEFGVVESGKYKKVEKPSGAIKLKEKHFDTYPDGKKRKVSTTKAKLSPKGDITGERKFTKYHRKGRRKVSLPFKSGGIVSKLRRGGIAQGKSPGVDTATTIDGTTYYKKGGMAKGERGKKYVVGGEVTFDSKREQKQYYKDKAAKNPYVKKYKLKSGRKVKDESDVSERHSVSKKGITWRNPKLGLGKNSKRKYNLKTASKQYYAEPVASEEKSRAMFKKGGKYKNGGIIDKIKEGAKKVVGKMVQKSKIRKGARKAKQQHKYGGTWEKVPKDRKKYSWPTNETEWVSYDKTK